MVLAMSPRLPSRMSRRSAGTAERSRSRTAYPALPNCSKNARFALTAHTLSRVASRRWWH
jgi:hypothetical protein